MKRITRFAAGSPLLGTWLLSAIVVTAPASSPATDSKPTAQSRPPARPLAIGERAPPFRLPGVDGKTRSLDSFSGAKVLVVVFTCNHCPTAQLYEGRIAKLWKDYHDRGVALVAISSNDPKAVRPDELGYTDLGDSLEEMKIRARQKKYPYPYLYDGDEQKAARAYGPRATPHVFMFDRERRLRYQGRIDDSETGRDIRRRSAREAIDALLASRPVPVETTRVFGCSIKWSSKREGVKRFYEKVAKEEVALREIGAKEVAALRKSSSGKLRMINVWATWCGPCVAEFDDLVATNLRFRHRELEFVTISMDDPKKGKEVLPFLRKHRAVGRNFLYDSEDRDALADALDEKWSGAIPLTLLVKPGGEIVWRHEGMVEVRELRRAIVANLAPWR